MKLLTIRLKGIRRKYLVKTWGYIDLEERHENIILKEWRLFDLIPIWRVAVFTEEVPLWAVINHCCLGSTYWQSKKPWLIDAAFNKRTLKTVRC